MSNNSSFIPSELAEAATLEVGPLPSIAGGPKAVFSSMQQAVRHMGVTRSLQALGAVNQRDGFDCPGCAWPDPDDRRSMVEFCENGAETRSESHSPMRRVR